MAHKKVNIFRHNYTYIELINFNHKIKMQDFHESRSSHEINFSKNNSHKLFSSAIYRPLR